MSLVAASLAAAVGALIGWVVGFPGLGVALALVGGAVAGCAGVVLAMVLPPADSDLPALVREVGRTGVVPDDAPASEEIAVLRSLQQQVSGAAAAEARLHDKVATLEQQLRRSTAKATSASVAVSEAMKARDAFLARMSHELRTPLNAVLGYSEMLVEELDDDLRPDAEAIRQAGRHLLGLVTSVLDLTQLQSGQYEVVPEDVALASIVELVVDGASAEAKANKNTLQVEVAPDARAVVDRRMVQSILFNLVHNACKYTASGTVTVRVTADPDLCELFVGDTGIGMTERQIEAAFRPFEQADDSTTRQYDGSGLGLAVCRGFAEAMGGRVAIDSAMGKGARVTVTLPAVVMARHADSDENSDEHTMLVR